MSAVATLLAEMGHRVTGHDPSADSPFLAPARRASASTVATGPAPPDLADGVDAVVVSTATPVGPPAGGRRPRAGRARVAPARALAGDVRPPATGGGGRHPRQDHHLGAARHDPGGRRAATRAGSSAPGSRAWGAAPPGAAAGRSSSRPTRATAPSSPSAPRPSSSPTSSPTTSSTGAASRRLRAAFVRFVAALPRSRGAVRRRPGAARAGRRARPTPSPTAPPPAADYRVEDVVADGHGRRLRPRATAASGWPVAVPGRPGVHNARNAAGALAARASARRAARRRAPPPSRASGAWPAGSRSGARPAASLFVDGYDHLPDRGRRRAGRGPERARGAASCAASSPTATAAPRRWGRASPTPSTTPTSSPSPTSTRRARRRAPGSPASSWSTPCSTPTRGGRWPGCPTLDDVVAYLARHAARRATSASRSAPATSPPCPTASLALPRTGAGDRAAAAIEARRPAARRRSRQADVPLGPLTTYRVGGPAALSPGSRTRTTSPRSRRAVAATGVDVLVVGQGLEPARGRRRLRRASPSCSASGFADDRRRRHHGPRRRRRRAAGGGPPHGRRRAHRLRVGGGRARLDRRRRADERRRPRLRPGRVARGGPPRGPAQRGGWWRARRPRSTSATAARRSPPTRSWCAAELALAPGDPERGGRAAGRDRGLAPRAPARRAQRRLGVHQPRRRLRRPPHRRRRVQGPPPRHRGGVAPSTPTSSRPTPAGRADDVLRPDGRGPTPGRGRPPAWSCTPRPAASGSRPAPPQPSTRGRGLSQVEPRAGGAGRRSTPGSGPGASRSSGTPGRRRLRRLVDVGLVLAVAAGLRRGPALARCSTSTTSQVAGAGRTGADGRGRGGRDRARRPADRRRPRGPSGARVGGAPVGRARSACTAASGARVEIAVTERTPGRRPGRGRRRPCSWTPTGRVLAPGVRGARTPARPGPGGRDLRRPRPGGQPRRRGRSTPWRWPGAWRAVVPGAIAEVAVGEDLTATPGPGRRGPVRRRQPPDGQAAVPRDRPRRRSTSPAWPRSTSEPPEVRS